jgi:hypothetical protein
MYSQNESINKTIFAGLQAHMCVRNFIHCEGLPPCFLVGYHLYNFENAIKLKIRKKINIKYTTIKSFLF